MGNRSLFPAGKRSEPRPRTAPKGLPQAETHGAQRRGPPSQSPCRVLSLVLSFASKESTPPSGRQPHHSRRSRRVDPPAGEPHHETIRSFSCVPPPQGGSPTVPAGAMGMRLRAHQRAFRSPFGNLRTPKLARNPWDVKSHSLAVVGAPIPLSPLLPSFLQRLYQPKMLPAELQ